MCLYMKTNTPIVAEKSVKCYKILSAHDDGELYTPFQGCRIELGTTITAYGYKDVDYLFPLNPATSKGYKYGVYEGFIHTFADLKAAEVFLDEWSEDYWLYKPVIVECTIPKGTTYYEGVFEATYLPCYASDKLKYGKKIIKTKKD